MVRGDFPAIGWRIVPLMIFRWFSSVLNENPHVGNPNNFPLIFERWNGFLV